MTVRILVGDVREKLAELDDESVQCVVTSPPYWRQRDYHVAGQIGLEQTPEEYIDALVPIFREARRALHRDGSLWLNIGDKWASGGDGGGGSFMADRGEAWAHAKNAKGWRAPPSGYKDKDLVGVPWMLAFALRADGWFLRQCNIWAKPNCMPESVSDRSTISHEYVFHLSKSNSYYYGYDDVKLPSAPESVGRLQRAMRANLDAGDLVMSGGEYAPPGQPPHQGARRSGKQRGHTRRHAGFNDRWDTMERTQQQERGAALRSVWWIAPANYDGDHFAVMPDELAALCILAGCPEGGTVLDPFGGVGTTGLVADRLKRHAILIEINPEYAEMARRRIHQDAPLFADVASSGAGA